MKIDPILLSVYARTFKSITDEMSISMQQTTAIVISDGYDCVVDAFGSFVLYAKGREDLVASALRGEEIAA